MEVIVGVDYFLKKKPTKTMFIWHANTNSTYQTNMWTGFALVLSICPSRNVRQQQRQEVCEAAQAMSERWSSRLNRYLAGSSSC